MTKFTTNQNILDAVTGAGTTVTGEVFDISMRKEISFQFTADVSAGNGVFSIEVSNDGVNFVTYNRLTTNVTNTNAQTDIGVASVTLNSDTSVIYMMRHGDHFRYCRAKVAITTDGTYTCTMASVD